MSAARRYRARMTRSILIAAMVCLIHAGGAVAQPASEPVPPAEHLGFGGYAGVGLPWAIVAARLSVPFHPRGGLDIDIGRSRNAGSPTAAFGAAVRWLRHERRPDGTSDYAIIGVLVMDSTIRTDIRFPDCEIRLTNRRKRLSGQIGYGVDWQARNGTRTGLEFAGGGSERSGPRLFARVFVVWGPAVRPRRPCPSGVRPRERGQTPDHAGSSG